MTAHVYILAAALFIPLILCSSSSVCDKAISVQGFTLENHYRSVHVETLVACLLTCLDDESDSCQSVSYDTALGLCKLNNETRYTMPEYFKKQENNVYVPVYAPGETSSMNSPPDSTTSSPPETTATQLLTTTVDVSSIQQSTTGSPPPVEITEPPTSTEQTTTAQLTTQPETTNPPTTAPPTTTGTPPTNSPPTTTGAAAQPQGFDQSTFCIGKAVGDYRHPEDCTMYVTCVSAAVVYVRPCGGTVNPYCNAHC